MGGHKIKIDCSHCADPLLCQHHGCQYLAQMKPPPEPQPIGDKPIWAASLGELMRMTRGITEPDFPSPCSGREDER